MFVPVSSLDAPLNKPSFCAIGALLNRARVDLGPCCESEASNSKHPRVSLPNSLHRWHTPQKDTSCNVLLLGPSSFTKQAETSRMISGGRSEDDMMLNAWLFILLHKYSDTRTTATMAWLAQQCSVTLLCVMLFLDGVVKPR
jgi:hypothetical protein